MRRVILVSVTAGALLLSGCASAPGDRGGLIDRRPIVEIPDRENPSARDREEPPPIEEELEIDVTEYTVPEEVEQSEGREEGGDAEEMVTEQRESYTIVPREDTFRGGAVAYNYVPDNIYKLYVSPYRVTDIELRPGETVVSDPAAGDTTNFVLGMGHSFRERERVEHVYVKPVYAGKQTTLVINTDQRTYRFDVESYEELYMPIVKFRYPLETRAQMRREAQRRSEEIYLSGNIENFDFGYEIVASDPHKPRWMPSLAFTDGERTYLQFASAYRASFAPALFSIEDGERTLLNYRVVGSYYIVDGRVIDHAELLVDANKGNIVTIRRLDN